MKTDAKKDKIKERNRTFLDVFGREFREGKESEFSQKSAPKMSRIGFILFYFIFYFLVSKGY